MTEILVADFLTGLMIFLRIVALLLFVPFFKSDSIPTLARLGLALIITYLIFFNVEQYSYQTGDSIFLLIINGVKEVFIGIILGFSLNLVFQGISFAGLLIGRDMGLAMSSMFDPITGDDGNAIATILNMSAIIVFILINGHHFVIESITYTFKMLPIGSFKVSQSLIDMLIKLTGNVFLLSIKIASPILVAFFLVHIASGIISRVSPSFQVFFVLLPLKIILGIFLLVLVMPIYIYMIRNLMYAYEEKLFELIKIMSF
ncbi:MAG: flagellar biosynthetic protein FliR [Ignavibacteriae bacterium]|nr:MAG: flagellar biosynthetic protein FliR [Ignavibacteriota bacterium]